MGLNFVDTLLSLLRHIIHNWHAWTIYDCVSVDWFKMSEKLHETPESIWMFGFTFFAKTTNIFAASFLVSFPRSLAFDELSMIPALIPYWYAESISPHAACVLITIAHDASRTKAIHRGSNLLKRIFIVFIYKIKTFVFWYF